MQKTRLHWRPGQQITQLDHTRSAHQIYLDLRKINKTNTLTLAKSTPSWHLRTPRNIRHQCSQPLSHHQTNLLSNKNLTPLYRDSRQSYLSHTFKKGTPPWPARIVQGGMVNGSRGGANTTEFGQNWFSAGTSLKRDGCRSHASSNTTQPIGWYKYTHR